MLVDEDWVGPSEVNILVQNGKLLSLYYGWKKDFSMSTLNWIGKEAVVTHHH
jgi:hypothetical protein